MRNDGRDLGQMRRLKIVRDYIKYAEGSCLIELGNTKVICTASLEETVPPFLKGKGSGWITAEYGMIPRSCQSRVPRESSKGRQSGRTYEIQRLIGRSLRTITDLEKLGERTIWIDADVVQADGGTRCVSITGSFIALYDALNKLKKDGVFNRMPLKDYVAAISVGILDSRLILDLTYAEDSNAQVDMNLVMTGKGELIEIQGTAERKPFSKAELDEMIKLGKKGINSLIKAQKKIVGDLY